MEDGALNLTPQIEDSLRPSRLELFVGQDKLKEGLSIYIDAAKKRNEPLSHVLLYGPPGLGKTTLANIIANELGVNCKVTSGPAIERTGDLAAILSNLEEKDVLFIDEIHRLSRTVEEVLYPAMEDFALDIILGKGPSAKTLRLDLPKFTLVGATTKIGAISHPMRDRFGVVSQLEFYSTEDLKKIIKRSARLLKIKINDEGAQVIAERSRRTPRIANRLLQRIRDFAEVKNRPQIDSKTALDGLKLLDIDEIGLDNTDRKLLKVISTQFEGGPVGIKTLAVAIHEDRQTLEEVIEPYLLQMGFLDRSPQGRKITPRGRKHIGLGQGGMF